MTLAFQRTQSGLAAEAQSHGDEVLEQSFGRLKSLKNSRILRANLHSRVGAAGQRALAAPREDRGQVHARPLDVPYRRRPPGRVAPDADRRPRSPGQEGADLSRLDDGRESPEAGAPSAAELRRGESGLHL